MKRLSRSLPMKGSQQEKDDHCGWGLCYFFKTLILYLIITITPILPVYTPAL